MSGRLKALAQFDWQDSRNARLGGMEINVECGRDGCLRALILTLDNFMWTIIRISRNWETLRTHIIFQASLSSFKSLCFLRTSMQKLFVKRHSRIQLAKWVGLSFVWSHPLLYLAISNIHKWMLSRMCWTTCHQSIWDWGIRQASAVQIRN